MKKIFGLFLFVILASAALSNDICLKTDGCRINTDTGICIECIDLDEFFSSRPPSPSCLERFAKCDVKWPGAGVCKAALNECRILTNVRLRLKWKKKSS